VHVCVCVCVCVCERERERAGAWFLVYGLINESKRSELLKWLSNIDYGIIATMWSIKDKQMAQNIVYFKHMCSKVSFLLSMMRGVPVLRKGWSRISDSKSESSYCLDIVWAVYPISFSGISAFYSSSSITVSQGCVFAIWKRCFCSW
jgi:hypothetical protein